MKRWPATRRRSFAGAARARRPRASSEGETASRPPALSRRLAPCGSASRPRRGAYAWGGGSRVAAVGAAPGTSRANAERSRAVRERAQAAVVFGAVVGGRRRDHGLVV